MAGYTDTSSRFTPALIGPISPPSHGAGPQPRRRATWKIPAQLRQAPKLPSLSTLNRLRRVATRRTSAVVKPTIIVSSSRSSGVGTGRVYLVRGADAPERPARSDSGKKPDRDGSKGIATRCAPAVRASATRNWHEASKHYGGRKCARGVQKPEPRGWVSALSADGATPRECRAASPSGTRRTPTIAPPSSATHASCRPPCRCER